jgi:hypothetical protein
VLNVVPFFPQDYLVGKVHLAWTNLRAQVCLHSFGMTKILLDKTLNNIPGIQLENPWQYQNAHSVAFPIVNHPMEAWAFWKEEMERTLKETWLVMYKSQKEKAHVNDMIYFVFYFCPLIISLTPKGQRPFFGLFLEFGQPIVDSIFVQKISNFC